MEIIKSNKGGSKLLCDGFMYTKKKESKILISWEYSQRVVKSCKGSLTSNSLVNKIYIRLSKLISQIFEMSINYNIAK